ncbi:MAG TPA: cytochrome c [Acidobacteriaceae bacterium]|nr:cytochrome c [Acidobacteriaceae bacterium]
MRFDWGQILAGKVGTAGWWRVPAGHALLAGSLAMAVLGAWVPVQTVHAFSRKDRAKAEVLFREKGCEHCHGVDGVGTERAPSLSTVGKHLSKAQIEQQIKAGGKQMPAFGDVLSPEETKELVDYLVHKKKPAKEAPRTS